MNKWFVVGAVLLAFAAGRYLTPTKIEIKTVEVEKKKTDVERDKRKETTTTVTENPDGTKTTVTKTVEDTNTRKSTTTDKTVEGETTKTYRGAKTSVMVLGATRADDLLSRSYGMAVSRQVLGPISVGGFFLTNSTVGVSLGLEF